MKNKLWEIYREWRRYPREDGMTSPFTREVGNWIDDDPKAIYKLSKYKEDNDLLGDVLWVMQENSDRKNQKIKFAIKMLKHSRSHVRYEAVQLLRDYPSLELLPNLYKLIQVEPNKVVKNDAIDLFYSILER